MSKVVRMLTLAMFAVLFLSLPSMGQQAPPSADTYVSSVAPNTNYGSSVVNVVGVGTTTYLKFNLSGVPTGGTVAKATLRLYVDAVVTPGRFDVFNLPATPVWSENALTFNTPPPLPGSSATGWNPINVNKTSVNNFVLIDITPTVEQWLINPASNNGVALELVGGVGLFSFDSKESVFTSHQPELEIVLNGPAGAQGPPGPAGAQGPAGPAGPPGPQGAQGPAGPMGSQGPQGTAGTNGTNGTNGQGLHFTGAFDNTKSYSPYDLATYGGSTYIATAANQGGGTPDTNPTSWSLMALQGQQGPPGTTGPAGPAGPAGINGTNGTNGTNGLNGLNGQGFNFTGAFDNTKAYSAYDVSTSGGSSYVATAPNQGGGSPATNTGAWKVMAQAGQQGPPGPAGSGQWNCPGVPAPTCVGFGCIFGIPGQSFISPDNLGTVFYNGDTRGPTQVKTVTTLPANGMSEHWYSVKFQTGSVGTQTLFGPAFVVYDGSQNNNSLDYVADAYDQYGQPLQQCNVDPTFQTLPALGVTQWSGNANGFSYNSITYNVHCAPAMTPIYIRVRPVSMNYQCSSYTLIVFNG